MWLPEDENSIPTQTECALTAGAITVLNQELVRAQNNVDQLKIEISKRTAWMAPIRRVPGDVLSLVFTEVCSFNWKAPLKLGAVCRRWRDVLIDTPRAWAFLQIHPSTKLFNYQLVELWIARCGAMPLHISLNYLATPELVASVCRHSKGIECLSFFNNTKELRGIFPQLKELRLGPVDSYLNGRKRRRLTPAMRKEIKASDEIIRDGEEVMKNSILDVARFPRLINLHLHVPSHSIMERIAPKNFFPPLQQLHIHASGPYWLQIVENCAETLTTLTIETRLTNPDQVLKEKFASSIMFPRLIFLSYIFGDSPVFFNGEMPNFQTPRLGSYQQDGGGNAPLHPDVALVTDLFLCGRLRIDWSMLPTVTHMRLQSNSYMMGNWAKQLEDASVCPSLCSIECIRRSGHDDSNPDFIQSLIQKRSLATKKPITFRFNHAYYTQPESSALCYTFCACISAHRTDFDLYDEGYKSDHAGSDPDSDNLHYCSDSDCFSQSNHREDDDSDGFF